MAESPAEQLRTAAKLMRERAEAATPGPWETSGRAVEQSAGDYADVIGREVDCMTYCYGGTPVLPVKADAEYIASMHPVVALAVASWLEAAAGCKCGPFDDHGDLAAAALAVARAYLGTPAPGEATP
jgi:hypothetical protein